MVGGLVLQHSGVAPSDFQALRTPGEVHDSVTKAATLLYEYVLDSFQYLMLADTVFHECRQIRNFHVPYGDAVLDGSVLSSESELCIFYANGVVPIACQIYDLVSRRNVFQQASRQKPERFWNINHRSYLCYDVQNVHSCIR